LSASETRTVAAYPVLAECLPDPIVQQGRYSAHFARSPEELDALQKLRFEVFNVELGEGLDESHSTGRDRDRFDPVCHHLIVIENERGRVVGTYRMQTHAMAERYEGFYSADEFVLAGLPREVIDRSVEVGRASVARDFRNRHVLFLLWRGLAAYMQRNGLRYLFGCCSLTSQDPVLGKRVMEYLERGGHVHPTLSVVPQPGWACYDDSLRLDPDSAAQDVKLPKLFKLYLRYGAMVCGPPAIDRNFKTIDYLVLLDIRTLDRTARAMFFE
jgi:putative hemolysin